MSDTQRRHREAPVRTGPIRRGPLPQLQSRSVSTPSPPDSQGPTTDASPTAPVDAVVADGVRLAYRVVEDHLRQGRQVAQQLNTRSYDIGKMSEGIQGLAARVFRDAADLLMMGLEMVNAVARTADPARNGGMKTMAADSQQRTTVAIEVVATRPTQVTLDLSPQSAGLLLATHGLRAVDAAKPPLTDISFVSALDGGPVRVRIGVPEGQPPGLYTGVVIDQRTGQVRGTLSVQVA